MAWLDALRSVPLTYRHARCLRNHELLRGMRGGEACNLRVGEPFVLCHCEDLRILERARTLGVHYPDRTVGDDSHPCFRDAREVALRGGAKKNDVALLCQLAEHDFTRTLAELREEGR